MKRMFVITISCLVCFCSCAEPPRSRKIDGIVVADDVSENRDVDNNYEDFASRNMRILLDSKKHVTSYFEDDVKNNKWIIDADVITDNVTRVSSYKYVVKNITDNIRKKIFENIFGKKSSEIKYDEISEIYELKLSETIGDYWSYEISYSNGGKTIPGEQIFILEYRYPDLNPFKENLVQEFNEEKYPISLKEATLKCDKIVNNIFNSSEYSLEDVYAYGTNGRRPYFKIVYKKYLDGMPVTSYNDLCFLYDKDGIEKISGSVYLTEEINSPISIHNVDFAIEVLKKNVKFSEFEDNKVCIEKIKLEYLARITDDNDIIIEPIWRFYIGNNEQDICNNKNTILAVTAVDGEFILEKRESTI